MKLKTLFLGLLLTGFIATAACSDDEGDTSQPDVTIGENAPPGPDAGPNNGADTSTPQPDVASGEDATPVPDAGGEPDTSSEPDTDTQGPQPVWDGTPVAACTEVEGSIDCFGNQACPDSQICSDIGVLCCVVGEAGTKQVGEDCEFEKGGADCASGVCLDRNGLSRCAAPCDTVDDCPATAKECGAILFSGSQLDWCLPTEE